MWVKWPIQFLALKMHTISYLCGYQIRQYSAKSLWRGCRKHTCEFQSQLVEEKSLQENKNSKWTSRISSCFCSVVNENHVEAVQKMCCGYFIFFFPRLSGPSRLKSRETFVYACKRETLTLTIWAGEDRVMLWERRWGSEQYVGTTAFKSRSRSLPCALPRLQAQGPQHLPDNGFSEKPLPLKKTKDSRSIVQSET